MIEINFQPSRKDLRLFAVLQIVFFAIVAVWLVQEGISPPTAWSVVAVSAAVGVVGFFWIPMMRIVYVGWMLAVFPIGWTVSHALLAVVYYGVVTPIGLIVRLCGRDPMQRRFDPDAQSYWQARSRQSTTERYFRQF